MGGMHALEWAVGLPDRVERLAVLAAPPTTTADQVALNSVQLEAIRMDPRFAGGEYYDAADGEGPHRGLALARRMALLNYRSPVELNLRFQRSWQSEVSPLGGGGRSRSKATSTSTATSSLAASTRTATSRSSRR
jgi:homoserine O-acetyltransferase